MVGEEVERLLEMEILGLEDKERTKGSSKRLVVAIVDKRSKREKERGRGRG